MTTLQVRLLADDVVVAESEAPALWASVLLEIQRRGSPCVALEPPVCDGDGSDPCLASSDHPRRSKPGH